MTATSGSATLALSQSTMTTSSTAAPVPAAAPARPVAPATASSRAAAHATRVAFFISGFAMAAWAPLVPFTKARLSIHEATLGLLLLCMGAGSIVSMPLAGAFSARWGCRRVLVASALLAGLALPLLALAPSVAWLGVALFLFGAGIGGLGCAGNIQAIVVERASGRPMMSGFHGLFSLGGVAGAGGMIALLSLLDASLWQATSAVAAVVLALLVLAGPHFLAQGSAQSGPAFARPTGVVLFIGTLCFILFLAEGAMLDWSAVFLTQVQGLPAERAGLGYAAFAVAMTVGRLTGDRWVRHIGPQRAVLAGALLAAAGLALATLAPGWLLALPGFALVGLGCSNIVPVLFSLAGRQHAMPESLAVPAIATMGYAGVLMGPALIGFVAHGTSLVAAMLVLVALLVGVAASARRLGHLD
ncbi:fucose permease [Acidovorax sp. CF316]|uniref:MFS transporter n=1 Tax=Acidovorax sp. CF316 TaxID=1144317 RepID=UPI00026BCBFA|nr:MFS transporter [Acidovorax sp. CF316]EJE49612.1 fucose permease [Acidovorax sp. CF316]